MLSLVPENTTITPEPPSSVVTSSNTTSSSDIPPLPLFLVNKLKNVVNKKTLVQANIKKSYAQASKANISPRVKDVLCIKDTFPELSTDDVERIIKVMNGNERQKKPKINITTKEPSRKQIIIPIAKLNTEFIINSVSFNIANINKCLKNAKSDIIADFIHLTNNRVIITTKKLANMSDLSIIEKYMKNINNINLDNINYSCLPKSKLYLKIIRLPHNTENDVLTLEVIKGVLKDSYLFENVILASRSQIIKASTKSDMVVVCVGLWDS